MTYDRHQAAREATHKKFLQESAQGLALYGYDVQTGKMVEPEMTEADLRYLLIEIKKLRLRYDAHILGKVVEMLDKSDSKKSTSCGCTGKSASAGRRETKTMLSAGDRPHFFANEMSRLCREQLDQEYDAFCAKFL